MLLIFVLILQLSYIDGCRHGEFLCKFSHNCVAASKQCDQVKDCPHGEDEHDCEVVCGEEEFKCDNLCLSKIFFCDGFYDCHDKSDEYFCPDIRKNHTCDQDHFMCAEGTCIPSHYVCDGQPDCVKSEDEQNCGRVTGIELANSEIVKVDHDCPAPNYKCADQEETCIAQRYLCDGAPDCMDGSDESNCGDMMKHHECLASEGMFACQKDTDFDAHVRCLPSDQVCNGKPQCPRGDDEGEVCNSTKCLKHGCGHHCMETSQGPTCFCQNGFKLSENGKSCEDVDECEEYGACSQICTNTKGSFKCSCHEGYLLNNRSCQYVGTAQLFITMMSVKIGQIRSYDIHTKEYLSVVGSVHEPVGVGFDLFNNRVFWTDANIGRAVVEYADILKNGSGGNKQLYLESGLEHPEDLVVDGASGLVYFSDSGKDRVVVCSVNTPNCSVVSDDHQQPRGLALHSTTRVLFVTEWGRIPRIVRMNFDGSNHKSIINTDIVWPNGIAVDETLDRIFWTDAQRDTIESADLNGDDRRLVISDVYHPFGIAVFEDNVYWSDWHDFRLFTCNKFTGRNIRMLLETPYRMNGISIHYSVFHSLSNPCKSSDCSHLCIPISVADGGKEFYSCKCPEGMYLLSDGINCEPEHNAEVNLMVAAGNNIYSVRPQTLGKLKMEPVGFETGIVAGLSSNIVNDVLIAWTHTGHVFNVNARWKTSQLVSIESDMHSIVFDHLESNLFWINMVKKTVVIMSELTKQVKTLITCTDPRALAYVASRNVLALVDGSHLLEASLDGETTNLLSDKVPTYTNQIVYNDQLKTYYVATKDKIYSTKPGLGYFKEVLTVSGGKILSLVILDGYLYWTQENSVHLSWMNVVRLVEEQTAFKMTLHIPSNHSKYLSATAFYSDKPDGPCAFKACSDICVTTSANTGLCICGDGRSIINDNLSNKCQDSNDTKSTNNMFNSPSQATVIGMFVSLGLVFLCIILLVIFFCVARRRNFKPAEFINRSFGVSPSHVRKEADKNQEMASIEVVKTGSRNEIENPGFDSVVLTPNKPTQTLDSPTSSSQPKAEKAGVLSGVINRIKKYRDPKMTELDWSESSIAYENLIAAKGSSTPSFKRLETIEERDSAHFSSSMDYEEGASFDSSNNLLV